MSPIVMVDALRSIGDDLELRGIKTFRIRCEKEFFAVDGGYQSPPAATPVSVYYSQNDIGELNRKAGERNDLYSSARAFIYLPEILYAIASYVRDKGARLLSLSNTASTDAIMIIDFEHETAEGHRLLDRLTGSAIYVLCVREHKRRERKQNFGGLRYSRFSSLGE